MILNSVATCKCKFSVRQRDDALKQIVLTMVSLSPFLALAVAICGSWFAGNAVKPVEETMELLRQFVADAAHEINTPISVIEASVQTLEATFEDSQLGSNVLAIINRASGRMKIFRAEFGRAFAHGITGFAALSIIFA